MAMGTTWETNTWDDNAWDANAWDDAGAAASGIGMRRMLLHIGVFLLMLLC